jgi:hypothetical protein
LKGNVGLGPWKTSTALRGKSNYFQVHFHARIAFLILLEDFGEAMGLKGQTDPILVLDAKGGENKAKARNGSATTWEFWKIVELELLFCQNTLIVSFLFDYGKKGEFLKLWSISLGIPFSMCIWIRDRKLSLICKNKPSGGKEWSKYAKFESKQICVLICIDVALLLVAFCCVGINHQKGGDWKGNVPLGHF